MRELRTSIRGEKDTEKRKLVESEIKELRTAAEQLHLQAREAQADGDRLYWPIYNIDIKNPNTPEEEIHDPDLLLEQYKQLLAEIEDTQEHLKNELGAALAHHFTSEGA